ncbi:MAG TPA: hypothetical protein VLW50_03330 [Streptosporangiaceae bacterium]|nr:hypothetical protein [Streptosporangiaceae bacterium]
MSVVDASRFAHVHDRVGLEHAIFGDDFRFLQGLTTTATPKLTVPRRTWCTTAAAGPRWTRRLP